VPANPEARAIGWYLKKALDEIDSLKKGGDPMSSEETVIEELKPDDQKPGATSAPADPKPENPNPEPEPEKTPTPSDQPPEKVAGKETKKKDKDTMKGNEMIAKIEPIWMMLDKLISLGGEIAPAAIEIKSTLKQALGETWTPPVIISPTELKTVSKDEMAEMISTEVKKQFEPLLKQIPAIRKGVIQPEPETEEVKKTFEGLPPQKKLKVALALQQA
jgi:hypothetical protein